MRFPTLFLAVYLLFFGVHCHAEYAELWPAPTKFRLGFTQKRTVKFSVPQFKPDPRIKDVGMVYAIEFSVAGAGICSLTQNDPNGLVSSTTAPQVFSSPRRELQAGDGMATGDWYLTITNPSIVAVDYEISLRWKIVRVVPQSPSKPLSATVINHLVSHGRTDNEKSFRTLSGQISAKTVATKERVFRIDWEGGANANYSETSLAGSRYIARAGAAVQKLLQAANVPSSKVVGWGHSWGTYIVLEMAKSFSTGTVLRLNLLDPAETNPSTRFKDNFYSSPNFSAHCTDQAVSIVTKYGLYGGISEASTAHICVALDVKQKNGSDLTEFGFFEDYDLDDDYIAHYMPIRCVEFSLALKDRINKTSTALTNTLLNKSGDRLLQRTEPIPLIIFDPDIRVDVAVDYTLEAFTDATEDGTHFFGEKNKTKEGALYIGHGNLTPALPVIF